jgi:dTMP kinase
VFVTFEGPEGAGKSTVIEKLAGKLTAAGKDFLCTREPGAGSLGKAIRAILLEGEGMPALSELFLFLADRANHVETIIRPALAAGKIVLCDRYRDSTVVYQGIARGLDPDLLRQLNATATANLVPDLTILLDLPTEVGLARVTDSNRLDREPSEFHNAVRNGFLEEAQREPNRWRVVDAGLPLEAVVEECWHLISEKCKV